MNRFFYITSTLPYVNAEPHIGFALEMVQADVIARLKKLLGYEVVFNTGTDEHGLKIYQKAVAEKKDPQSYCDGYAAKFIKLKDALNLSYTHFIRTTDQHHMQAAQEFWTRCFNNGDIYKKMYAIKYCVGCELEKTDSELKDNRCPLHPNQELEIINEENYFFRFSKYQQKLLDLYKNNPQFIIPDYRQKEIVSFVQKGLEDFSVSRLKSKMPWGVDVPNDSEHVMYVWFDALINYISTLGWPADQKKFRQFWPGFQIAGKDNLRQQSAMWQAMLMSAGLPSSRQIFIHGFITSEGQKMSKSLGNVVDPIGLTKKYGTDAVRFYLLKEIPSFDDGNFSYSRMEEIYSSDLANELGNLVMRITNLSEKDKLIINEKSSPCYEKETLDLFENYQFSKVIYNIWQEIKKLNKDIDEFAPWKKSADIRRDFLIKGIGRLKVIGQQLLPLLPETADKIINSVNGSIKKAPVLFPKL